MTELDLIDRKIIYELDADSRQSYSKIGKKVRLHKNVVKYRVNRLKENGIITNFYTVINSFKLGYNAFRMYISYRHITPEKRKEILDYFIENQHTWWVVSFDGSIDLCVVMWVKELYDFYKFWEKTLNEFHHFFRQQIFCNYVQLRLFRYSFLLDNYDKMDREADQIIGAGRKIKTDETDIKILQLLSKDSRIPTLDIAKKLGVSTNTIKSRIKNLIDEKIILGYRVGLDYSKIGYHIFKVNINLNRYDQRKSMIRYIRNNPHLVMIDKSIGYYDLELDLWVKDLRHFHQIMDDIVTKFPDDIRNYEYAHDPIDHKVHYIPE
jgi:Lrp/AsnC family transcriptional regulator for asnA, asnC and gidA